MDTGVGIPGWMLLEPREWSQHRSEDVPGKKHGKHHYLRDRQEKHSPQRRVERSRQGWEGSLEGIMSQQLGEERVSGRMEIHTVKGPQGYIAQHPPPRPSPFTQHQHHHLRLHFGSGFCWFKCSWVLLPDFSVTMAVSSD